MNTEPEVSYFSFLSVLCLTFFKKYGILTIGNEGTSKEPEVLPRLRKQDSFPYFI